MNPLFMWIATRATSLTAIVYPDFSGKLPGGGGKAFSGSGVNFSQAYNDGVPVDHQAIDFYTAFRNYLRISRPIFDWIRITASGLARFLYYIANSLITFFVEMFKLFDVAGTPFNDNGYAKIHQYFHYGIWFGFTIMSFMLVVYVIGELVNGASFSRNKNIFRNIVLILFTIFGLPSITSVLTTGANDVAHDAMGNRLTRGNTNVGTIISELFQDNVYSVPRRIEEMKPGARFDTGTPGLHEERAHAYYDVNARPLIINLHDMTQSTRNKYNGLGTNDHPNSISTFLTDYGHDQLLDPDELNEITTSARDTAAKEKGAAGQAKNAMTNAVNNIPLIGSFLSKTDQGRTASDFTNLFSYYIADAGPSNNGGFTGEEHKLQKFTYGPKIAHIMYQSYTLYYVNWFAIYSGLIMMIMVTATYLYKLFKLFYKLVVMFVSSGFLMARNVDNYGRLKSYARDMFSVYEMLIVMVVMYEMFFTVYEIVNGAIDWGVSQADSGFIENPYVEACVDLIADFALFRISMTGIDSVDKMIGSEGGGANTGSSSFIGNMLAIRGAEDVGRHIAGSGPVQALAHPFKSVSAIRGGRKDHIKDHKKPKQADTGKRTDNKNGGFNKSEKAQQAKRASENAKNARTASNSSARSANSSSNPSNASSASSGSDTDSNSAYDSNEESGAPESSDAQTSREDSEDHVADSSSADDSSDDSAVASSDSADYDSNSADDVDSSEANESSSDEDESEDASQNADNTSASGMSDDGNHDNSVNENNTSNGGNIHHGSHSSNSQESQNQIHHKSDNVNNNGANDNANHVTNHNPNTENNQGGADNSVQNNTDNSHKPLDNDDSQTPPPEQHGTGEPDDSDEILRQMYESQDQGGNGNGGNNTVNKTTNRNNYDYGHNNNSSHSYHAPNHISFKHDSHTTNNHKGK